MIDKNALAYPFVPNNNKCFRMAHGIKIMNLEIVVLQSGNTTIEYENKEAK